MCRLCVMLLCVFGLKVHKKNVLNFSVFLLLIFLGFLLVLLLVSLRFSCVCFITLICVFLVLSVLRKAKFIPVLILKIMPKSSIEYLDIFGQPIKRTYEARVKEYSRLIDCMQKCNLIKCPDKIAIFSYLCHAGFVSARVASYFLSGRVSPRHRNVLSSFLNFLHDIEGKNDLSDIVTFSVKYLSSWHNVISPVAVESTFLSPLVELASSDPLFGTDFTKEFVDYGL